MSSQPDRLATETSEQRYQDLDTWPSRRIISEVIATSDRAVEAVREAIPQLEAVAEAIETRLAAGGRLAYAGAGTSGRIALQDAAELVPTFGFDRTIVLMAGGSQAGERAREGAEDDIDAARNDVARAALGPMDALLGIAASGRTPYTVEAVRAARKLGALTVGIANNAGTPLLAAADMPVLLATGPEVLAGSTRLSAGTAQKVALNALTTAVLVRLGGAFGNLMVGMALSNDKLRRRGIAIVRAATGVTEREAEAALAQSDGSLRTAMVSLLAGVSPDVARAALSRNSARVREALRELGGEGERE